MEVLWQQQDGGYMLPWQRYDNKMAAICYYGNVMATTRWRLCVTMETLSQHSDNVYFAVEDVYTELVIDVFYIFNSTIIERTCYYLFLWGKQIVKTQSK